MTAVDAVADRLLGAACARGRALQQLALSTRRQPGSQTGASAARGCGLQCAAFRAQAEVEETRKMQTKATADRSAGSVQAEGFRLVNAMTRVAKAKQIEDLDPVRESISLASPLYTNRQSNMCTARTCRELHLSNLSGTH